MYAETAHYRRIHISMVRVTAVRAGEGMTFAHPTQTTARTILTRVGRVHLSDTQPTFLSFVLHTGANEASLPQRHSTSKCLAPELALLWFGHMQVLKDEHGILRGKGDQLLGCLLGKGAGTIALCATKPFEKTPNTVCIFLLCLTGRMFALETSAGLGGTSVFDFDVFPTHKEGAPIGVNCDKGIGLLEINPYRENPCGSGASSINVTRPMSLPWRLVTVRLSISTAFSKVVSKS
ncbi:hypothetical protein Krac_6210 [Ktedonobacter racemifer DSM 44963]|uniref:Uncharacterized protein n=1 Tax=Ktedonobacter racemifer DSM 44963 TaxID=485913 RepID=D6TY66_KTERA|nr:hypothetical protein Krac_6210 [Ktedonobacter racemifer DSM 44963]